jgi:hypothetical protein
MKIDDLCDPVTLTLGFGRSAGEATPFFARRGKQSAAAKYVLCAWAGRLNSYRVDGWGFIS